MSLLKKFLAWRIKRQFREKPSERTLVRLDKFGNKYYVVKGHVLPSERATIAWIYLNDNKYNLSAERMENALEMMREAINKRPADLDKIAAIRNALESAIKLYCEKEVLLNLALHYTFMNDEPDSVSDSWIQAKKRNWEADKETESFFLTFAHTLTERYSQSQNLNVPEYLDQTKEIVKQIHSILTRKPTGLNSSAT